MEEEYDNKRSVRKIWYFTGYPPLVCMRNAGLPIESLIEYQRLFRAGDSTIPARLELLNEQMDILQKQKEQIEETMDRLSYKISRYEEAVKTGKLVWTKEE